MRPSRPSLLMKPDTLPSSLSDLAHMNTLRSARYTVCSKSFESTTALIEHVNTPRHALSNGVAFSRGQAGGSERAQTAAKRALNKPGNDLQASPGDFVQRADTTRCPLGRTLALALLAVSGARATAGVAPLWRSRSRHSSAESHTDRLR